MTRWPIHPPPVAGEALTSWLRRIATEYRLSIDDLIFDLGFVLDPDTDLDMDVPAGLIEQLSLRSGVSGERIQMMSIRGYVPWLVDDLSPAPEAFATYARQFSVLLAPRRRRKRAVGPWTAWRAQQRYHRFCPVCLAQAAPVYPYQLFWSWPVMLTCPFHHCRLEEFSGVHGHYDCLEPLAPPSTVYSLDHPVVVMDRRTWQGLTCGYVDLPRRRVHAGVWFRLLRTIVDELCATVSECGVAAAITQQVWARTGHEYRAGLSIWRVYERLTMAQQHQVLEASATAICLLENSDIAGRGHQAALFLPEPEVDIAPGRLRQRNPPVSAWVKLWPALTEAIEEAQQDPYAARRLFNFIVAYRRRDEKYVQSVRDNFEDLGISLKY